MKNIILLMMIFITGAANAECYRTASGRMKCSDTESKSSAKETEKNTTKVAPYISIRSGYGLAKMDGVDGRYGGVSGATAFGLKFKLDGDMDLRGEAEFTYNSYSGTYEVWAYHACWVPPTGPTNGYYDHCLVEYKEKGIQTVFMANAYFDFLTDKRIQPYIGFGLGSMNSSANTRVNSAPENLSQYYRDETSEIRLNANFTYGIYVGAGFNFTSSGSLVGDLGIRHLNSSISDIASVSSIGVNFGIRRTF